MKVVTIDQMRRLEARCESRGISTDSLMEKAGLAVAEAMRKSIGSLQGEHIVVLVGPGNNGGDGLVAARHLSDRGAKVHVVVCAPRREPDEKMASLAARALDIVPPEKSRAALAKHLPSARAVLDALLGTGRARPLQGAIRDALRLVSQEKARRRGLSLFALDLPTGLDADTGACDPATPHADLTITLGFPKVGLFCAPGSARVGRLEVVDIGIPQSFAKDVKIELATPEWARALLPSRPADANKGTFGRVLVFAGSADYIGAAYLACAGALRAGAGLVTLATPKSLSPLIAKMLPEATHLPLEETAHGVVHGEAAANQILEAAARARYDALLIGCGLGQHPQAETAIRKLLASLPASFRGRVVLDADALNILARMPSWPKRTPKEAILTPHPGEMSRLARLSVKEVQTNRFGISKKVASSWGKVVLLKGAYSLTASPGGAVIVNPVANPALATAGTGDVLAGVVAALLGQGLSSEKAAALGAYLHGAAGELVRSEVGDTGAIASDLLQRLPRAIAALRG